MKVFPRWLHSATSTSLLAFQLRCLVVLSARQIFTLVDCGGWRSIFPSVISRCVPPAPSLCDNRGVYAHILDSPIKLIPSDGVRHPTPSPADTFCPHSTGLLVSACRSKIHHQLWNWLMIDGQCAFWRIRGSPGTSFPRTSLCC